MVYKKNLILLGYGNLINLIEIKREFFIMLRLSDVVFGLSYKDLNNVVEVFLFKEKVILVYFVNWFCKKGKYYVIREICIFYNVYVLDLW